MIRAIAAAVTVVLGVTVAGLPTPSASGLPPTSPACLPLAAGSTGLLYIGGYMPTPDSISGAEHPGFGPAATGKVAASLPRQVTFRTATETFNDFAAFAVRDGRMYVGLAELGRLRDGQTWHLLELPDCLDGHVKAISADSYYLTAITTDGQFYSHDLPNADLSPERWTWRFGPYFWTGSGFTMPAHVRQWATSSFGSYETFEDSSGRTQHPIGVATVYLLRSDGRHITLLDPWLPVDDSRETCVPREGRQRLAGLSASGSQILAIGANGSVWTRLYDFDISGANTVFGKYSWHTNRPASDTRWQLPAAGWQRQPAPPARVLTNRVNIFRTGTKASRRMLRIEGRALDGSVGYFEKTLLARHWKFHATGGALLGTRVDRVRFTPSGLGAANPQRRYLGSIAGHRAAIASFNAHCTESTTLRVDLGSDEKVSVDLMSSDGMRQAPLRHGLSDVPREYNAALAVPRSLWRTRTTASPAVQEWLKANFPTRVVVSPLRVTATRILFLKQCWSLTLNGEPARPDSVATMPDGGVVVGRLTEWTGDNNGLPECLGG